MDLVASGVAYKERMNLHVIPLELKRGQPEKLQEYFKQRLQHYRNASLQFPLGNNPIYQKKEDV